MIRFLSILILLVSCTMGNAQEYIPSNKIQVIVSHSYYTISYSEAHEQAEWVYYVLTSKMVQGPYSRTDDFRPDPFVKTGSASKKDYYKSGYDRGHLAPAADMTHSATAMSESFYYSNMSPQEPSFNRGGWKKLESQVRNWAVANDSIYVVTGPVLSSDLPAIGANSVAVPDYYYKVIYAPKLESMVAFLMPNQKLSLSTKDYGVSVDEVELKTGIDFFPQLADSLEAALEKDNNAGQWDFNSSSSYTKSSSHSTSTVAVQCLGISKSSGNRCRNKTKDPTGYCHLHQSQNLQPSDTESSRCMAITQKGTQCKRDSKTGSNYCWQHEK